MPLNQAVSFLYNTSEAGTSFANDKIENTNRLVSVKLR